MSRVDLQQELSLLRDKCRLLEQEICMVPLWDTRDQPARKYVRAAEEMIAEAASRLESARIRIGYEGK